MEVHDTEIEYSEKLSVDSNCNVKANDSFSVGTVKNAIDICQERKVKENGRIINEATDIFSEAVNNNDLEILSNSDVVEHCNTLVNDTFSSDTSQHDLGQDQIDPSEDLYRVSTFNGTTSADIASINETVTIAQNNGHSGLSESSTHQKKLSRDIIETAATMQNAKHPSGNGTNQIEVSDDAKSINENETCTVAQINGHCDISENGTSQSKTSSDVASPGKSGTIVQNEKFSGSSKNGTQHNEMADNDTCAKAEQEYEQNNREKSSTAKSLKLLSVHPTLLEDKLVGEEIITNREISLKLLSVHPTLLEDKLVGEEIITNREINSTLNDSISSLADGKLDSFLHDESGSFRASRRSTAFSTDSRIYNVFTFLDNDDDYDGDVTDDDVISRTNLASLHHSLATPVTMTTNEHDVMNKSREDDDDTAAENDAPAEKLPHTDVSDTEGALKLERQSSDTSLHTKRKIIPNMELLKNEEFDLAFTGSLISTSSSPMVGRMRLESLNCTDIDSKIIDEDDDDDYDLDDIDIDITPEAVSGSDINNDSTFIDTNDKTTVAALPQYSAQDEFQDNKDWRIVVISDQTYRIDMKAIEPYKKVLAHGGYYGNGLNAIIVFTACHLPERSVTDYQYIMDNLFLYVISTLELLVVEDYMIIYFHGATSRRKYPSLWWLKRCYDMINRRLKKNLRGLVVVHPTLFLKTLLLMTRPFISSKFTAKMRYVKSLLELTHIVPTEYIFVPAEVISADRTLNSRTPSPRRKFVNY